MKDIFRPIILLSTTLVAVIIVLCARMTVNADVQAFEVSYTIVGHLDLDSTYLKMRTDISLRLVDSMLCRSVQLVCTNEMLLDTVWVDGVQLGQGTIHLESEFRSRYWCHTTIPLSPPMLTNQSRTISLAYRCKVRTKELKKGVLGLSETIPLVSYIRRPEPGIIWSGDGRYLCEAKFDYRLTVTPPTLAVGDGELLNQAEFTMAAYRPNDTVQTDLISEIQFPTKLKGGNSLLPLKSSNYSWKKEMGAHFDIMLLRGFTLDRSLVGSTQVDLYYPRKSKNRWATWAVPVIARAVKENLDKRNWGPYPFRFIVGKLGSTYGYPPIFNLPNKKFNAVSLHQLVTTQMQNYAENVAP